MNHCYLLLGRGGSNGYLGNAQMNCYIFMVVLPLHLGGREALKIERELLAMKSKEQSLWLLTNKEYM